MQSDSTSLKCEQCGGAVVKQSGNPNRFCSKPCVWEYHHNHPRSLAERWTRHVLRGEGCWEWTAFRDPNGYGRMTVNKRPALTHRVSWELHFGPIPRGLAVCHKCDNPPCVRPDHLFLGTNADNMQDASRKGRTTRGERGPAAKLTPDQVRSIRSRYAAGGISQQALAREYGMGQPAIGELIRRETWTHVTP